MRGAILSGEGLAGFLAGVRAAGVTVERLHFVCIGTDRSSGDAFGPFVGTLLVEAGYDGVVGTLAEPCDSVTLLRRLAGLEPARTVLAVDCCLGPSVGRFQAAARPVAPGSSMGRPLPEVGDYSIAGIVAENRGNPYRILQETSLHRVLTMARQVVAAVQEVFPLRPPGN